MQRLIEIFNNNGFQTFDRRINHFDLVLEKDNTIFVLKEFKTKRELEDWSNIQNEINLNIYLKVDNEKKLNIYFILFINFNLKLADLDLSHQIEKDRYYCRKIIIRNSHFINDLEKLPFLPIIELNFDKSTQEIRVKTIQEFLKSIVDNEEEFVLAKEIFDLKDEKNIAIKIIKLHQKVNK